jgi:hypothetical protein
MTPERVNGCVPRSVVHRVYACSRYVVSAAKMRKERGREREREGRSERKHRADSVRE